MDILPGAAYGIVGLIVGVAMTWFAFNRGFREEVREAAGQSPQVDARVSPHPTAALEERLKLFATKEELAELVRRFEADQDERRDDTGKMLTEGANREERLRTYMHDQFMRIAEKIGEARGELKRIQE